MKGAKKCDVLAIRQSSCALQGRRATQEWPTTPQSWQRPRRLSLSAVAVVLMAHSVESRMAAGDGVPWQGPKPG